VELAVKNIDSPDEAPELPLSRAKIVHIGDTMVVRGELDPGWRWSNAWKPVFGTPSCQMPHTGIMLEGRMHFELDDGREIDLGPGDAYSIPPGHDAWVVGNDIVRSIDWAPEPDEATKAAIQAAMADQRP
jgi:hypothetical protein